MDEHFNINPDVVNLSARTAAPDPFADQWLWPVYLNEPYRLNFNKLLHLAPYSEVLQVSGPMGVGKTTLLQQFVISAKKSWKVVYIQASSLMTSEELLREVIHGFGLTLPATDRLEDMLRELTHYLQAVRRSGRRVMVVIDDAHLLAKGVVGVAERILGDEQSTNALSLVLGTDEGWSVDALSELSDRLAYTLRLDPLAESDVAGYIHHRLVHSGNGALESHFGPELVAQLHKKSGGLPGRLNELARARLGRVAGKRGTATVQGRGLVRSGLILVGIALVGTVLLFQEQINQWVTSPVATEMQVTEVAVPEIAASAGDLEGEPPPPSATAEVGAVGDTGVVPEGEAPALNMGALVNQPESAVSEVVEPQAAVEIASKPAPPTPPIPAAPVLVEPEPVVAPKSVVPVKPDAAPVKEPARQPASVAEKGPAQSSRGEGWLKSQPPQHYTLQLMALADESQVKQFVIKHKLQGQSDTLHIRRNGQRLTALVYGSFPSRTAADEAARSLPAGWGIKAPWVRTFAALSGESGAN